MIYTFTKEAFCLFFTIIQMQSYTNMLSQYGGNSHASHDQIICLDPSSPVGIDFYSSVKSILTNSVAGNFWVNYETSDKTSLIRAFATGVYVGTTWFDTGRNQSYPKTLCVGD